MIRLANTADLDAIEAIYDAIHTQEEAGEVTIGWNRAIYPTRATAEATIEKGTMFVLEDEGRVVAAAKIDQEQVDVYANGEWRHPAEDEEVMVLHTLVIDPGVARKGYATKFVDFYETFAKDRGCSYLRMDTNEINVRARSLYRKLGYEEIGIVPCTFNGIDGVQLVLLEKKI